jgi:hypothetical protein
MIIGLLCIAMALAMFFPETPIGGLLKRLLVDLPAHKLNGLTRTQVTRVKLFVAAAALLILSQNHEIIAVFGQGLGEAANWFVLFDVSTFIDVLAMACIVAATIQFRAARDAIRAMSARAKQWALRHAGLIPIARAVRNAARSRRSHSSAISRAKDDKESPLPDFGLAFA